MLKGSLVVNRTACGSIEGFVQSTQSNYSLLDERFLLGRLKDDMTPDIGVEKLFQIACCDITKYIEVAKFLLADKEMLRTRR